MSAFALNRYLKDLIYDHGLQNTEIKIQPDDENFSLYSIYLEDLHKNPVLYKDNHITLLFALEGNCKVRLGMSEVSLTEGNDILINPNISYEISDVAEDTFLLKFKLSESYNWKKGIDSIKVKTAKEKETVDLLNNLLLKNGYFLFQNTVAMNAMQIVKRLTQEYIQGSLFATAMAVNYLNLIILDALKNQLFAPPKNGRLVFNHATLDSYIDTQYSDVTLQKAAAFFGFNKNYFSTMVKSKTGKSFVEHVDERKMVAARELLSQPDLSLKEIIEKVGYSSKSFFYKKFDEYYGTTPAALRKSIFRQAKINLN